MDLTCQENPLKDGQGNGKKKENLRKLTNILKSSCCKMFDLISSESSGMVGNIYQGPY